MIKYQRIVVATGAHVGEPADLPTALIGLDDSTLANLDVVFPLATLQQLNLVGAGFLPVVVPDPPVRVLKLTLYEFLTRFTPQERVAIRASTDPIVIDFLDLLDKALGVELDSVNTIAGMNYLVEQELLTAERSVQVLGL